PFLQQTRVALPDGDNFLFDEVFHLLRRAADKILRFQQLFEIKPGKSRLAAQPVDQVVARGAALESSRHIQAVAANGLVKFLSIHCVAAVCEALTTSVLTNRARPHMRSARIGLRLYAIADEPTCSVSNGSSNSWRCESRRRSVPNLCADWPMPDSTSRTWLSS